MVAYNVQSARMQAVHCKLVVNRDVKPNNLMHTQSQIYLVDWGSATLQQNAPFEGTVHYASIGVLRQLTQTWNSVEVGPADDLESLVASLFCISHPDAHSQLQKSRQAANSNHAVVDTNLDTATTVAAGFESS